MEEGRSTFTSTMSSPFMDAFRTAHANATKEFGQFYHYVSKAMTPRRSQHHQSSDNNMIRKPVPETTKRTQQKLDERHSTNMSSLTPIVERRLSRKPMTQYPDGHHYLKSPTSRRRKQNYPPPQPMTLAPNTTRKFSVLDRDYLNVGSSHLQQQDEDKDDQGSNVYLQSPHRSTYNHSLYSTPTRKTTTVSSTLCPSTPSVILHDHLQEEARRLDQLQHDVLIVQQQSLALSRFSSSSSCIQGMAHNNKTGSYYLPPPSLKQKRYPQRRQSYYSTSTQHLPKYTHSFNGKTPLEYQHTLTDSMTPQRSQPSLSAAAVVVTPSLSSPPIFTTSTPLGSPSEERQEHPLFTTPPLQNRFISSRPPPNQCMSNTQRSNSPNLNITINSPASTSSNRNRQRLSQMDEDVLEEKDMFWMDMTAEELGDDEPLSQPHTKTLDQELGMAKDKLDVVQQQQQQQQIQSKTFFLRPSDTPLILDDDHRTNFRDRGTIDGDQWTFAGKHYIVHEKQE